MNIPKAIEIQKDMLYRRTISLNQDQKDSIQLGIEAQERLEVYRNRHPELIWELLPSETED